MTTLFALNFDSEDQLDEQALGANPVAEHVEEGHISLSPEDLDTLLENARQIARDEALQELAQAAKAEAEAAAQSHSQSVLDTIAQELRNLATQDDIRRRELERDVVELFIDIGERIVPEMLAAYSSDLALDRIRKSLRMVDGNTRITVRVSPTTHEAVTTEIENLTLQNNLNAQPKLIADPSLRDGEARLDWENGFMEYSLDLVCSQLMDALHAAAQQMNEKNRKPE